jgi:hypothetical protein
LTKFNVDVDSGLNLNAGQRMPARSWNEQENGQWCLKHHCPGKKGANQMNTRLTVVIVNVICGIIANYIYKWLDK